jgi:hypothetical protein
MKVLEKIFKTLPAELVGAGNDLVHWTAFNAKGAEYGKWGYNACYASAMQSLENLEIHCRPFPRAQKSYGFIPKDLSPVVANNSRREGRLSPLQYARLTRNAFRSRILVEGVKTFHDPEYGNCLTISRGSLDRHSAYVALSFYRWMDSRPQDMWSAVMIMDHFRSRGVLLPFLQCLHYVIARKDYGAGHGFIHNYSNNQRNPALGWAWAKFNSLPVKERAKLTPKNVTWAVYSMLADTINPQKNPVDSGGRYPVYPTGEPILLLKDTDDLLSPKLSPLYTHPERFGPEEFKKLMEGIQDAP